MVVVVVVVESVAIGSLMGERKVGVSAVGEGRVVVAVTGAEEEVVRRVGSVGGEAGVVGAGQEVCSVGERVRKSVGRVEFMLGELLCCVWCGRLEGELWW